MADFQFQPDAEDPITKLRMAMEHMDGMCSLLLNSIWYRLGHLVDALCSYRMPEEKYDYITSLPEEDVMAPPAEFPADPEFAMNLDPQLLPSQPKVKSNLRLFPPPIFSQQTISQNYKCVK